MYCHLWIEDSYKILKRKIKIFLCAPYTILYYFLFNLDSLCLSNESSSS